MKQCGTLLDDVSSIPDCLAERKHSSKEAARRRLLVFSGQHYELAHPKISHLPLLLL